MKASHNLISRAFPFVSPGNEVGPPMQRFRRKKEHDHNLGKEEISLIFYNGTTLTTKHLGTVVFINKEQGRTSKTFKLSREHSSFPEGLPNPQGPINRLRNSLNV